jgi:hypothetical protein
MPTAADVKKRDLDRFIAKELSLQRETDAVASPGRINVGATQTKGPTKRTTPVKPGQKPPKKK